MSAQVLPLNQATAHNLRPFDMRRDLLPVADLVELCFAESLDADGRMYIRQMRQAARHGPLLMSPADLPMSGYVWQEGAEVVGNLSLIPHRYGSKRIMLIANVAVHPRHRRRGIARALTQAALQDVQRRGVSETWLQVDDTNPPAVNLYRGLGFVEQMKRTSWRATPRREISGTSSAVKVRSRQTQDWKQQQHWLQASYPPDTGWQLPLDFNLLQPGWRGALERALRDRQVQQWSAVQNKQLVGVLSWQSTQLEADRLWLAAPEASEEDVIPSLMQHVFRHVQVGRPLALNYPGGRAQEALTRCGFHAARTLIWMNLTKER